MKVPEDRNPCLTVVAVEKKSASKFTKKGNVLKDTHEIAMEAIRPRPSLSRDLALLRIIMWHIVAILLFFGSVSGAQGQATCTNVPSHDWH